MSAEIDEIAEGEVVKVTHFGAFVELPGGRVGLVHISEIADEYVSSVSDHLSRGDKVTVRVLGTDEQGRYQLSVRQAAPGRRARRDPTESASGDAFEEKLKRFMKESQERLLELKRNTEAKRGRSRRG